MEDSPNIFDSWNILKKKLDSENHVPYFKEREVWWCSLGVNVGHEQDGENKKYNRPVLIIKKFNNRLFWGVPLTTKIKNEKHYHQFNFKDRKQCAMLTQMRLWDANRLTALMGRVGHEEFKGIKFNLAAYLK